LRRGVDLDGRGHGLHRWSACPQFPRHLYAVVEGLRWPTLIGAYTPDQAAAVLDDHLSTLFG
jgi:hypothetical protein